MTPSQKQRIEEAAMDRYPRSAMHRSKFIAGAEFLSTENEAEKRNAVIQECIDQLKPLLEPEVFEGLTIYNEPDYNHGVENSIEYLEKLKTSTP